MRWSGMALAVVVLTAAAPLAGADESTICQPQTMDGAYEAGDMYVMTRTQGSARLVEVWQESNDFHGLQMSRVYCGEAPEQPSDRMVAKFCVGACPLW